MRTVGKMILAIGAGLGVWVITNLADVGYTDIAIVLLLIAVGATLTNARNTDA